MDNLHEQIQPDVPKLICDQATPVERYLLDKISVAEQQNMLIMRCLEQVHHQTKLTNGRVNQHDLEISNLVTTSQEHSKLVNRLSGSWKVIIIIGAVFGPMIMLAVQSIIKYLGWL